MNPWDYAASLQNRWRIVLAATLLTLAAVAIWSFTSTRLYEASATLLFGGAEPSATTEKTADASTANAALLGTQADVIGSDLVARQVVSALDLADRPELIARWRAETGGRGTIESWLSRSLLGGLTVAPTKNSQVLQIAYRSSDPDYSATIANAFADAFIKTQLMLRVQPARVYSDWFEQRTADVRNRLAQAQARLTKYQQDHGLIGGERTDVEMGRLSELSNQLGVAEAASADAGARASNNVGMSPEVQSSAVVQSLRTASATASARLSQLRSTLGPNHPDVVTARAELSTLQAQLGAAVGTAAQSVKVASAAAQGREASLRGRMAAQRAHVLAMSNNQDAVSVLQRDVDTAKQAYDGVTQRLNAVRLQSEIPQADATLLDRASPSYLPVSPNIPLRLLLGLLLGVGLGVTIALALEWRSPRVRTDDGVQQITGLPVLASLEQWPLQIRRLAHHR